MVSPSPSGIVWIASYPRSGNTWVRNFLFNIITLTEGREPAGGIDAIADTSVWDIMGARFTRIVGKPLTQASRAEIAAARPLVQRAILEGADGPVLVKTHNALVMDHGTPTIDRSITSGAVYIIRNPLDAVISNAHHFGIDLETAIGRLAQKGAETEVNEQAAYEVYGSWSENVASWTAKPHPAILILRYEDMLEAPSETFARLAGHLLIEASDAQIGEAIALSTFERAKRQEQAQGYRERPAQSKAFFREGRAGQWREVLTPAQIARIVGDHGEQMARFGYLPAA